MRGSFPDRYLFAIINYEEVEEIFFFIRLHSPNGDTIFNRFIFCLPSN
jgi:hypothetical protein